MRKSPLYAALFAGLALASAADTAPEQTWRYFAVDAADNPFPNQACITNGAAWALAVDNVDAEARTLRIACKSTYENAYLTPPGSAPTLDLRGAVHDAEGVAYTIAKIAPKALGGDSTKGTAAAVVTPGTLTGDFTAAFAGFKVDAEGATIEEAFANYAAITIDEPNLKGTLRGNLVPRTEASVRLTVRVPRAVGIDSWALASSRSTGTFTGDSFLSVQALAGNGLSNSKFDGVLNLPAVTTLGAYSFGGNSPGFSEIQLSAEARALARLDAGCGGWMTGTTNLVLGFAAQNVVAKDAFNWLQNLRRVEFTGHPPTFAADAANVFTGPAMDALTFVVPPSAAWAAYLAPFAASGDFVRWSPDAIRAWRAEHPEGPIVIGTVNGNVFKGNTRQYLAVADRVSSWIGLDFDRAHGDAVDTTFEIDDAAPFHVALRLSARAGAGGAFAGWYGDVPDGERLATTRVLRAADPARWTFARFTHPWTLTREGADAVLDNGAFRILATVSDEAAGTLTLGRKAACTLYAPDNAGDGVLDLGGAIAEADGRAWRIVSLGVTGSLLVSASGDAVPGARIFVSPGTLNAVGANQLFHATNRRATYEAVLFDEPAATGGPAGWFFSDQKKLRRVVFRCPKFTFTGGLDGMLYNSQVNGTDVGWWTLDGVKTFGTGANNDLKKDGRDAARLRGSLRLPFATAVGAHAFQINALGEALIGYGDAHAQVVALGAHAFNDAGLTNLVLNAAPTLAVGADACAALPNLASVVYLGPVVNADAFAAVLASATAEKPVTVYASALLGWDKAPYLDAPTDEERTQAPARLLGVWRGEGAAVRAWVCHRPSPFDPKGTLLRLR